MDIDQQVTLYRQTLRLPLVDPSKRPMLLGGLASALHGRFRQTGQLADLHEAVMLHRDALSLRPELHPDRSISLNNLANALTALFDETGQIQDLNESITLHEEALVLRPDPHPHRHGSLSNLANAVYVRFGKTGEIEDLNRAVQLHRDALNLSPASNIDRPNVLNNLAIALDIRAGETGRVADLEEAVELCREALRLQPPPHPERTYYLDNLANSLTSCFRFTGQRKELDEAISLHRDVLDVESASHPGRWMSLTNLTAEFLMRFDLTGELQDLDDAVALNRDALQLLPDLNNPHRSDAFSNLALALVTRFKQTSHPQDLDETVQLNRKALELRPAPHPYRWISLNNLAAALERRSAEKDRLEDLNDAIVLHQQALELRPEPHPDRSSSLNNLAVALHRRSSQPDHLMDLDQAIAWHREALRLRPKHHPKRSGSLNNLATVLHTRFNHTGLVAELDEAILMRRELLDLGELLVTRNIHTPERKTLEDGISHFRAALKCASAPVSDRLFAAKLWAQLADGRHESALEAYKVAIELLPHLAMLGLDLHSRQEVLMSRTDGLAQNAAACAIQSGEFGKAIELLEEGRAIFWSQALQLRTPLDELHLVKPKLEKRLRNISRALELGSFRNVSRSVSDAPEKVMLMEKKVIHYRKLNADWIAALEEVRHIEGFHDFLRPRTLSALQNAAAKGPVIILNAAASRCAALILTPSDIQHIPLPDITVVDAKNVVKCIRNITDPDVTHDALPISGDISLTSHQQDVRSVGDLPSHFSAREGRKGRQVPDNPVESNSVIQSALEKLWTSVAEPIIHFLELSKSESPPRLWWYPTGPFAFLPIHAAGIYNTGIEAEMCVSDYAVSSYTPTLTALLTPPPPIPVADSFKMMVVIQPERTGYLPLSNTIIELRKIMERVPAQYLVKLGTPTAPAYVDTVYSHFPSSYIAHIACHGKQNFNNPLESALVLADGELMVSRIMAQPMPNASLAFLSACQTAMGDENLPEEAIHLAATLLFAGFRGVVATMWSMVDSDGPKIADTFYSHLFQPTTVIGADAPSLYPNTTEAARALHFAVAKLRKENAPFIRWVPFIHLGL